MRLKALSASNVLIIASTLYSVVSQRTRRSNGARGLNTEQKLGFDRAQRLAVKFKKKKEEKRAARYIAAEFCYKLFPNRSYSLTYSICIQTERIIARSLE